MTLDQLMASGMRGLTDVAAVVLFQPTASAEQKAAFLAQIGARSSAVIVSADVSDATINGATAPGKVLKTDEFGSFAANSLALTSLLSALTATFGSAVNAGIRLNGTAPYYSSFLGEAAASNKEIGVPNVTGKLCVLPAYVDNSAALAGALTQGVDIYWNTTTKSAKVVQAP